MNSGSKEQFYAKVIQDSIAPNGKRLITMEVRAPRFILAEINTHKMLAKSSASSRAIPVKKRIEMVREHPVEPVEFGLNKAGMQATELMSDEYAEQARIEWHKARIVCLEIAERLDKLRCHKQISNRVIETWAWNTQIITGTEWTNFFFQRMHKDAQPEFQHAARLMYAAQKESTPKLLLPGEWHMPYIQADEQGDIDTLRKCSAARCARVSGVNFETGTYDIQKDLQLFDRLVVRTDDTEPKHWSPLEHIATPIGGFEYVEEQREDYCDWCLEWYQNHNRKAPDFTRHFIRLYCFDDGPIVCSKCAHGHVTSGNLVGWTQFRKTFEDENRDF